MAITNDFDRVNDLILFFTPEAEVLPHFVAQCAIAKNLEYLGYKTAFVFCPGILSRCPSMDCHQLSYIGNRPEREFICLQCKSKFQSILAHYKLSWIDMGQLVDSEVADFASNLVTNAGENIVDLNWDHVPFGKLAFGDYAIAAKAWDPLNLSEEGLIACRSYAESAITTYIAVSRLCTSLPIKTLVRFNDYSNNMAAEFSAKKHSVKVVSTTYATHLAGTDRRRIVVMPRIWGAIQQEQIKDWEKWSELPLDTDTIKDITRDLFLRFEAKSSFTYSPERMGLSLDLLSQLNLTKDKKTLVAFTSSADERFFSQQLLKLVDSPLPSAQQIFTDQIDWLHALIEYVETSNNLQLVVRIHPREGKTARYPNDSEHLIKLRECFNKSYKNSRIVWPEDQISSYDLLGIADLGLTSWSSIGIEMARLGIPVVTAFQNMSFPSDVCHEWGGPTRADYFNTIHNKLAVLTSIETIKRAYRCYNLFQLSTSVLCDDIIPTSDFEGIPNLDQPSKQAEVLAEAITSKCEIMEYNLKRLRNLVSDQRYEEEETAIVHEIESIIYFLCCSTKISSAERVIPVPHLPDKSDTNLYIKTESDCVHFIRAKETCIKYSPMLARLVKILAQSKKTTGQDLPNCTLTLPN